MYFITYAHTYSFVYFITCIQAVNFSENFNFYTSFLQTYFGIIGIILLMIKTKTRGLK